VVHGLVTACARELSQPLHYARPPGADGPQSRMGNEHAGTKFAHVSNHQAFRAGGIIQHPLFALSCDGCLLRLSVVPLRPSAVLVRPAWRLQIIFTAQLYSYIRLGTNGFRMAY